MKPRIFLSLLVFVLLPAAAAAQSAVGTTLPVPRTTAAGAAVAPTVPKDYIIGIEDVLSVIFWRDKDLSADVVVRPDGKISLPMLNDLLAAGMTPEQLAQAVERAATKFVRDPGATVIVKEIHSRKVYVIGEVTKPGTYPLGSDVTVLQMIVEAGGFLEDANKGKVVIVRNENGRERRLKFNYNDVVRGKHTEQNIRLLPGDTILVR